MTSWSAKYSTCNAVATTLTILAPATVIYGGTATVVATLKVDDDAAFGRLALNPLSGPGGLAPDPGAGRRRPGWPPARWPFGPTSGTYTKTLDADVGRPGPSRVPHADRRGPQGQHLRRRVIIDVGPLQGRAVSTDRRR